MVWTCPSFKNLPDEEVNLTLDRIAKLIALPGENWDELKQYYDMIGLSVNR